MKISIVVPTHDRHQSLLNLISSVKRQGFDGQQFEIIIVANLIDPFFETSRFKSEVDGIQTKILVSGKVGVNRARNLGIKEAAGDIVLLLDDDCELIGENYLSRVESCHERYAQAVAIGGGYVIQENATPLELAYNCVANQWQSLDFFGGYQSPRLVGGNVSYKRKELLGVNELFDESILFGGTEAEFHQRLRDQSLQVLFLPSLEVLHRTNLDFEKLIYKAYKQAQGHIKYTIESGFSEKSSRVYQNKRLLIAREHSGSEQKFTETMEWMKLYDWAYNYSCKNPSVNTKKLYKLSRSLISKGAF